jgi:hypothetical protein
MTRTYADQFREEYEAACTTAKNNGGSAEVSAVIYVDGERLTLRRNHTSSDLDQICDKLNSEISKKTCEPCIIDIGTIYIGRDIFSQWKVDDNFYFPINSYSTLDPEYEWANEIVFYGELGGTIVYLDENGDAVFECLDSD